MRLSCPNCGAQYEVPAEVIPQDGRDVQCSNCGHTWFQMHPDKDVELAREVGRTIPDEGWSPEDAEFAESQSQSIIEDPAEQPGETEVQPPETVFDESPEFEDDFQDDPDPDMPLSSDSLDELPEEVLGAFEEDDDLDETDATWQDADEDDHQPERERRSGIDPSIADVLRQEAEYEAQAREADSRETIETQTELGLSDPPAGSNLRAAEARARMRRIRGLPDADQAAPQQTPDVEQEPALSENTSRRELLPDIEEINSTLRSTDDRRANADDVAAVNAKSARRGGFRLGFGFMMLFAAMIIMAYVYNQDIVKAYPQTEPYVTQFMEQMNAIRVWLDTRVTEGMLWLDDKASSAGGNVD